jgi:zinc protease
MNRPSPALPILLGALCLLAACAHQAPAPAPTPPPAPAQAAPPAAPQAPETLPGEESLKAQPEVRPLEPFDAPVPQVTTLPNGLRIYVVERPTGSIEALELVVRRGSVVDPPGKAGLASLTASMLEAGSAGRTQTQMAQAVDAIGAELSVIAGEDATAITISALPTRLDEMVKLLSDVALRPNFDKAEWAHLKGHREAELLNQRAQPVVAASLAFGAASYGGHPLGQPLLGTSASVKAISLQEVKDFYQAFSPRESAIIAVGSARGADVVAAVTKAFGGWKPGKAGPSVKDVLAKAKAPAERPRLVLVNYPDKPQTVLRVGQPAVSRASPDYLALRVLNSVLGGSFTSRLNVNLREKNGYSYGAGSRFYFGTGPGPFITFSNVKTEVTGPALKEVLGELERALAQPLTPAEVDKGKALLAFDLVSQLESAPSAALALSQIFIYDLPLDEFRRFVPGLQALTPESIQAAAKRALDPSRMTIVVAGDESKLLPQLSELKLPEPQRRDPEGQPVKAGK